LPSDAEVSRINRMLMGYQLPGQDYLLTVDPDLDLDPEYGLGTTGARSLDAGLKQGFQLANKIDPGTKDFWFAGWVKVPPTTRGYLLYFGGGGLSQPGAYISVYNEIRVSICDCTIRKDFYFNDLTTKDNNWHFIVVTVNRTTAKIEYWVDNVKGQIGGDISELKADLGRPLYDSSIGCLSYSLGIYPLDGSISRFCYGEGTLPTEDEIKQLYNRGQGLTYAELPASIEAKVTHYWNCMEGSDGKSHVPLYDAKGSNDGSEVSGNLVTNGTFDSDSDWTKGTGWSIASGVASCDGTQTADSALSQVLSGVTAGTKVDITFTIKE